MDKKIQEINEDEMIGYISRNLDFHGIKLSYEEINIVLQEELNFLRSKGIAD